MQEHNVFFWESQKKGRSRFNLLLLEYGEYFFEDLSVCQYIQNSPGLDPVSNLGECLQVQGRLKVCSRSIIFEPNDIKRPILKYPFKGMLSTVQEVVDGVSSQGFLSFRAGSFFEMKANNKVTPYKLVEVKSAGDDSSKSNAMSDSVFGSGKLRGASFDEGSLHVLFALLHSDLKNTVRKIEQLRRIFSENEQSPGVSEQLLLPFIQAASSTVFDSSQMVDFHEKLLLDEAVTVKRIKPLIQNPGLLMVTVARVYFQPSQLNNVGDGMQCIELSKVSRIYCRRYLLRQTGLEFFMNDGSSTLFVFGSRLLRDKIYRILISANITVSQEKGGASYRSGESLDVITRKWQTKEISNFDYLMHLNNEADRSVNDLTQYPVFPHVIADYEIDDLDLENPETFRDLSKPIGALNQKRLDHFLQRFESMPDADLESGIPPPFLYGTHYSTPGYVLHYLVRVAPEYMFCLQNGKFDAPDRMFYSMKDTWDSCLSNPTDLKELIPEFFCGTGEFLKNADDLDLGRRQTGDRVDNVDLPLWAKRPLDFIRKNRRALESDYVSDHIHEWIDLIFGYKQKGEPAIAAHNLYYYLTYEGSVDLEQEKDVRRRAALEIQIQEFGQTPKQLFASPHPARSELHSPIELCKDININTSIENQVKKEDARRLERESHRDEDIKAEVITLGDDFRAEVVKLENAVLRGDTTVALGDSPMLKLSTSDNSTLFTDASSTPKLKSRVGSIFTTLTGKTASFFEKAFGGSSDSASLKDDDGIRKVLTKEEVALIDAFRTTSASPSAQVTAAPATKTASQLTGVAQKVSPESVDDSLRDSDRGLTITSLEPLHTFPAHTDSITDISGVFIATENNSARIPAFSVVVCSCSKDTTLKVLQFKIGEERFSLHREFSTGTDFCFSSCYLTDDATHVLLGCWDHRMYSYSILNACASGKQIAHDDVISCLAFVNDASNINSLYGTNLLLTGALDGSVKLWRVLHSHLLSSEPVAEFQVYENAIHKVSLKHDLRYAAAGADDGTVIVWDVQTQLTVLSCKIGRLVITGIVWVPSEDRLICSSKDGYIAYMDASQAAISSASLGFSTVLCSTLVDSEILCLKTSSSPGFTSKALRTVMCGCGDGSLRAYRIVQTGDSLLRIEEVYRFPRAHEAPVTALAEVVCNPGRAEEQHILLSGGGNGQIRIWRVGYT